MPLRRLAVRVPAAGAEPVRALLLELCPAGFEERVVGDAVELAAYGDRELEVALRAALGTVESEPVAPGWEDAWRAFHRPLRLGSLWVGPPWEVPPPGTRSVVVDPGRAFGTGAHATTRLCLELLLAEAPGPVLDVGCGSGVLAIAAARLGFAPVLALDVDPAAVEATTANARANEVDVDVRLGDALTSTLPIVTLVLANLELRPLEALAPRLTATRLIASGLLADERPTLEGWTLLDRREHDGWAAEVRARRADPAACGTIPGRS